MSKNKSRRSKKQPRLLMEQVSDALGFAALMAAAFSILAFQAFRYEGFEAEKIGIVGIAVSVLIGIELAQLIRQPRQWAEVWREVLHNPVTLAALGVLAVTTLSAAAGLNPSRSFYGAANRSQGLLALILSMVVYLSAARRASRFRESLPAALLIASLVAGLMTIIARLNIDPYYIGQARPGSVTGNANFLSAWLVMVVLYLGPQAYAEVMSWQHPLSRSQQFRAGLYGSVLILNLAVVVFITSSRGALLSFGVSLLLIGMLVAIIQHKQRLVLGLMGVFLAGVLGYVTMNRVLAPRDPATLPQAARIFQPTDPFRAVAWRGGVEVIAQQGIALTTHDGSLDRLAVVRPLIGYGPDSLDHIQTRFYNASGLQYQLGTAQYVDRFHNFAFDTIAQIGWLGLISWVILFEAIIAVSLRQIGLIQQGRQWWLCIGVQAAGAILSAGLMMTLFDLSISLTLMPISATLGAIAGLLTWIAWRSAHVATEPIHWDSPVWAATGVLAVTVAQLIDLQFSFVQASTQITWWLLLGILVASTQNSSKSAPTSQPRSAPGRLWIQAALTAGLFFLYGMGTVINGRRIQLQVGSTGTILFILAVLLTIGLVGWWAEKGRDTRGSLLTSTAIVAGVWVLFFTFKTVAIQIASVRMDEIFDLQLQQAAAYQHAVFSMAWPGALLAFLTLAVWAWPRHKIRVQHWSEGIILLSLVLGSLAYIHGHRIGTLHKLGLALAAEPVAEARLYSASAYQAAINLVADDTQLRLEQLNVQMTSAQSGIIDPLDFAQSASEDIATLMSSDPFIVHSRHWLLFMEDFTTQFPQ